VKLGRDDLEGVVASMTKGASVSGTVLFCYGGDGGGTSTSEDGSIAVRGLDLGKRQVAVHDRKGLPMSWAKGSGRGLPTRGMLFRDAQLNYNA
jgi:hypothetical protein